MKLTAFISIIIFSVVLGQLVKFPFGISGSATFLDLVVGVLGIYGLSLLIFKKKLSLSEIQKLPWYLKSALIFILVALISWVLTPLQVDLTERLLSFLYIARLTGFIFLAYLIYKGIFPFFEKSDYILTISGILLAIIGLLQLIFIPNLLFLANFGWDPHYFRIVSTFLDPNFVGGFFVLTLILLFQNPSGSLHPSLRLIFFLLVYFCLALTFSRSSYLMFFISFLTISLLRKSISFGFLTILLTSGLILNFYSYERKVAEPKNIDRESSAESRLNTWEQGFKVFYSSPILGVGYNNSRYALIEFNLAPKEQLGSRGSTSNDSSLLSLLATTGIVGFLSYVFMLFTWFKTASITLKAALFGLVINSFFVNSLFYPFDLFWVILILSQSKKLPKNV